MTTKTRVFKNDTKIIQVYYDRFNNPHSVKPGETFVEDLSSVIDVNALVKRERDRISLEANVDETRRVKRALALVKSIKNVDDLDKLKEGETNPDVLAAILVKQKEVLEKETVNGDKQ